MRLKDVAPYEPRGAHLSPDGVYRYSLWRRWSAKERKINFVMLNPSTADAYKEDPTTRWCVRFAKRQGFTALCITNLFAFRSSSPALLEDVADPVGPWNEQALQGAAQEAEVVVCAWGVGGGYKDRDKVVIELLKHASPTLYYLGATAQGFPRHPLWLPHSVGLQVFR